MSLLAVPVGCPAPTFLVFDQQHRKLAVCSIVDEAWRIIERRSLEQVHKQLKLASQRGRIGQLSADQPSAEVQVSSTVATRGQV